MLKLAKIIILFFCIQLLAVSADLVEVANVDEKATITTNCAEFADQKRVEWLKAVAQNGDVKGNETLMPAEYKAMLLVGGKCAGIFSAETVEIFRKEVESLASKQTKFGNRQYARMRITEWTHLLQNVQKQLEAANGAQGGDGTALEEAGLLVLASKKLLMQIFSLEGEAARISVHAFMQLPEWRQLKLAFELSKIQSPALDQMIIEDIWKEHLANRRHLNNNNEAMRRAVISGGGPVGLLAAFRLFMAGMDVNVVNDRTEYVRTQIVGYDSNWMAMLRYMLGTKYNTLFQNEHSSGLVTGERGIIGIRFVEEILKQRLVELAEYVRKAHNKMNNKSAGETNKTVDDLDNGDGGTLRLLYGYSVFDLVESQKEKVFYAKVKKMSKRQAQIIPEEKKSFCDKTKSLCNRGMQSIPVDLLLCVGGANDKLRQHLFAPNTPKRRTRTVNYTNGTYKKQNHSRKINVHGVPAVMFVKMKQMQKQLEAAKFDELLEKSGHLLSKEVREQFKQFTEQLLQYDDLVFLFIENWEFFSLNSKTPKPMDEILKWIEQKVADKSVSKKTKTDLEAFGQRIRWKWCAATFNYAYQVVDKEDPASPEPLHVNIDPKTGDPLQTSEAVSSVNIDPIGTRSFDVTVWTMDKAAMERRSSADGGKHSAVVAVLGDALANTHYYSGAAMSTGDSTRKEECVRRCLDKKNQSLGREGVEFLLKSIKESALSGKIHNDKNEFVQTLIQDLGKVVNDAVMLTTKFVADEVLS